MVCACIAVSVEHTAKPRREFVWEAWFRQQGRECIGLPAFARQSLHVSAKRNDGNVPCLRRCLEVLKKLPAVAVRHRKIGDDDVGVNFLRAAIPVRSVLGGNNVESHH